MASFGYHLPFKYFQVIIYFALLVGVIRIIYAIWMKKKKKKDDTDWNDLENTLKKKKKTENDLSSGNSKNHD